MFLERAEELSTEKMSFWKLQHFMFYCLYGNFFLGGGGWASFFKATLMPLIEVQNVFPIINYDVLDRLEHVWDIFDTVGSRKSNLHCQILPDFSAKLADFGVFKAFISNFLYYNLYQRKVKVITRPQCALRFFIRLLDFPLVSLQLSIRWLNFMSY